MTLQRYCVQDTTKVRHDRSTCFLSNTLLSMYEVSTALRFIPENDQGKDIDGKENQSKTETISVQSKARTFCTIRDKWLAVSINTRLFIFDLSIGVNFLHEITTEEDELIVSMEFLPRWDLLVYILSSGSVCTCFPRSGLTSGQKLLPAFNYEKSSSMAILDHFGQSMIAFLDRGTNSLHYIELRLSDVNASSNVSQLSLNDNLALISKNKMIDCDFVLATDDSFIFFPSRANYPVKRSILRFDEFEPLEVFLLRDDVSIVRASGTKIVTLTPRGILHFYNFMLDSLGSLDLSTDLEIKRIFDVYFIDVDGFHEFSPETNVLIKALTNDGSEICIRPLQIPTKAEYERGIPKDKYNYHGKCAENANVLTKLTPNLEGNIIYFEQKQEKFFIRFITQSRPNIHLERLLELKRFREAEEFARTYGLSLDKVYRSLLDNCQELMKEAFAEKASTESLFTDLMGYLAKLSNHDEAGDYCVSILNNVNHRYKYLQQILEFAGQLKMTDEYTQTQLSHFRYELESYRQLYGTKDIDFGPHSEWPLFSSCDTHFSYFSQFCFDLKIDKARIIFARYRIEIANALSGFEAISDFMLSFMKTVVARPGSISSITEFLETDLFPLFFSKSHGFSADKINKIGGIIYDLFEQTVFKLESETADEFPQNALILAKSFKEIIFGNHGEGISPQLTRFVESNKDDESSWVYMAKAIVSNLTELLRIKVDHRCLIKYDEFLTMDVRSICYRILLENVRTTNNIREHIEHFVVPYILKHGIQKDEILLEFVRKATKTHCQASTEKNQITKENPWDQICLQVSDLISDVNLRCKAINEIAGCSALPWSSELNLIVQTMLSASNPDKKRLDPILANFLQKERMLAELGQIFSSYSLPLAGRSQAMNLGVLRRLIQFICTNKEREIAHKLHDAQKIVNIYEKLRGIKLISGIETYYIYCEVIIQREIHVEEDVELVVQLLGLIKTNAEKIEVANRLVQYLQCLLVDNKNKKVIGKRLVWASCLLCILERYFSQNDSQTQKLIFQTRSIKKLQDRHGIVVDYSLFDNQKKKVTILRDFIQEATERVPLSEVVAFSNLLFMKLLDVCQVLLQIQAADNLSEACIETMDYLLANDTEITISHMYLAEQTCAFLCKSLTELQTDKFDIASACSNEVTSAPSVASHNYISIGKFINVLAKLISQAVELNAVKHLELFCRMLHYYNLFRLIIEHLFSFDEELECENKAEIDASFDYFFKIKPDHWFYAYPKSPSMLGESNTVSSIKFEARNVILRQISMVASSLLDPSLLDPELSTNDLIEFDNQMRDAWAKLFNELNSLGNSVLEFSARHFASSLPCFAKYADLKSEALSGYTYSAFATKICEKIIIQPKPDIQLATHMLLSLQDSYCDEVLDNLRVLLSSKKDLNVQLDLAKIITYVLIHKHFIAKRNPCSESLTLVTNSLTWLDSLLWKRRLVDMGVQSSIVQQHIPPKQKSIEILPALVAEFARALVPPSVVVEYCVSHQLDSKSALLLYIVENCRLLCVVSRTLGERAEKIKDGLYQKLIYILKSSLRKVNFDDISDARRIFDIIGDICPYQHDLIELLLNKIVKVVHNQTNHPREFFDKLHDSLEVLNFLKVTKRQSLGQFGSAETKWYEDRQKRLKKSENAAFFSPDILENLDLNFSGMNGSFLAQILTNLNAPSEITFDETTITGLPKDTDQQRSCGSSTGIISSPDLFPPAAKTNLPYHLFLDSTSEEQMTHVVMPVLYPEIGIYNVKRWSKFFGQTREILKFSRTCLMIAVIWRHIQDTINYKRELNEEDIRQIKYLIDESSSRVVVLKGLATRLKKIPNDKIRKYYMEYVVKELIPSELKQ